MTKDEWRNLKQGNFVTDISGTLYVVNSTGWDDLDEPEYTDDTDYIIEVTEIFEHLKIPYNGGTIFTINQIDLVEDSIPLDVINSASHHDNPYDFIDGWWYCKRTEC